MAALSIGVPKIPVKVTFTPVHTRHDSPALLCVMHCVQRDTTYSNGTYYLQVRIDCISYNRNHFGLANEALAGDLPINVMGVPMLAAVPASLRELRAYRPAVAASAAGPGAEAIPGAYEWPLRGLLPHGTRVTHI